LAVAASATFKSRDKVAAHSCDKIARLNRRCDIGLSVALFGNFG